MAKKTAPDMTITEGTQFTLVNYWGNTVTHTVERVEVQVWSTKTAVIVYTACEGTKSEWNLESIILNIKAGELTLVK